MDIKKKIRTIPHWPKQGVMFRDITTLLNDKEGFNYIINYFYDRYKNKKIDVVAGIESRGFILGGAIAHRLGVGFIPLRKLGKLPHEVETVEYELEYGKDRLEIHKDAVKEGENILIIDDLIATGGSSRAACELIERLKGNIIEVAFIINLKDLKGLEKLKIYNTNYLVEFEGE